MNQSIGPSGIVLRLVRRRATGPAVTFRSFIGSLVLLASACVAQADDGIAWKWRVEPAAAKPGEDATLIFSADIPAGSILYSSDFKAELGPRPAKFVFEPSDSVALEGPVEAVQAQRKKDKTFGMEYSYFAGRAEFRQKVRVLKPGAMLSGRIDAQTCQEKDGLCLLLKEPFAVRFE